VLSFKLSWPISPPSNHAQVVPILGYLYFQDDKSAVPAANSDIMKGSLSLGMIVGQIGFGLLSDTLGRKAVYGKELIITLFGTLMVILLPWKGLSQQAITAWVSVFRVVSGIGIGAGKLTPYWQCKTAVGSC
jgi:PHS family inorganic phosphate transporter-like MFS transporter